MKIHINSLNQILFEFISNEALPKYENVWRSRGESNILVDSKSFMVAASAKLMLRDDLTKKFPIVNAFTDSNDYIEIDNVKDSILETYNDFKSKGKSIIIPVIDWEIDEEDINKLYEISKKFGVKEEPYGTI